MLARIIYSEFYFAYEHAFRSVLHALSHSSGRIVE